MGYDVSLCDERGPVEVPSHTEGGTIRVGGSDTASISITYNYSFFFYHFLDREQGLRWLYGKTGQETIARLEQAVETLGTRRHDDYWTATPGNAGHILSVLLGWARAHPQAVWEGD